MLQLWATEKQLKSDGSGISSSMAAEEAETRRPQRKPTPPANQPHLQPTPPISVVISVPTSPCAYYLLTTVTTPVLVAAAFSVRSLCPCPTLLPFLPHHPSRPTGASPSFRLAHRPLFDWRIALFSYPTIPPAWRIAGCLPFSSSPPVQTRMLGHLTLSGCPSPDPSRLQVLTIYHLLLTTYYSLLTTHYSLLTTFYLLLSTYYLLLSTFYLLLTAYSLHRTPYSLLLTPYSLTTCCSTGGCLTPSGSEDQEAARKLEEARSEARSGALGY